MSRYHAVVARSADDLDAVFRLRYRIYVQRMGLVADDHPYVTHGRLIDPYDPRSTQLLLRCGDEPVGTLRLTTASSGPLELEEYRDTAAYMGPRRNTGEITRLMVLKHHRSMIATGRLFWRLWQTMRAAGVWRLLAAGKLGSLGHYYRNFGLTIVDEEPFAYDLVPGSQYQVLLGDFGAPGTLRRAGWTALWQSAYAALPLAPVAMSRVFRRGLSEESRRRGRPEGQNGAGVLETASGRFTPLARP